MKLSRNVLALAALALVPTGYALAQTPMGSVSGTVLEGEVSDVFGTRFILEDENGRVLVDPASPYDAAALESGDRVVVTGEETADGFVAHSITLADGTVILSAAAAAADVPTMAAPGAEMTVEEATAYLDGLGLFTEIRFDERDDGRYAFDVVDTDGRSVDIELNLDGAIHEIDVDDDRPSTNVNLATLLPETLQTAISDRGIVDLIDFDIDDRHYEIEGYDASGRKIEIEIGFDQRTGSVAVQTDRPTPSDVDIDAVTAQVEAAGYAVTSSERKPRHIEMIATSPEGSEVRLHVDFEGQVYRETLVR
ncbi:PepSY domain-containing protein [Pelagibacterium luteolum]|uniref:Peptidase propeptide and YPEB domain-containing protein n=1 Tax=Pelagibacterium luteolum TaxID=440168 RepID=A0A1G7RSE0_9HYPH|nr:PepSY domain-containing protein [Pelagibacterium luteolum]SDG12800.1 Peptidase propeptide and YPEB domain-containing protein [Pelagibacterium luteolum]